MVQDDGPVGLDGVRVRFDDERVVSDAGLVLAATVATRLGIEVLAQRFVRLRPKLPGASNAGRKAMSLIYAMALGADSIDDCDVLRSGRARRLPGGWIAAPSTLDEQVIARVEHAQRVADLRTLKARERRDLSLHALGYEYKEICDLSWAAGVNVALVAR